MATTEQKFLDYPGLEYYHQQNIATMDEKDVSVLDNSKSYTDYSVQAKGNELGTRIDNLILNAGDSSAECADARVTKDGTVHDTLKNRLDTEYSQLSLEIAEVESELKETLAVVNTTLNIGKKNIVNGDIIEVENAENTAISNLSVFGNVPVQNSIPTPTNIVELDVHDVSVDLEIHKKNIIESVIYSSDKTYILSNSNYQNFGGISVVGGKGYCLSFDVSTSSNDGKVFFFNSSGACTEEKAIPLATAEKKVLHFIAPQDAITMSFYVKISDDGSIEDCKPTLTYGYKYIDVKEVGNKQIISIPVNEGFAGISGYRDTIVVESGKVYLHKKVHYQQVPLSEVTKSSYSNRFILSGSKLDYLPLCETTEHSKIMSNAFVGKTPSVSNDNGITIASNNNITFGYDSSKTLDEFVAYFTANPLYILYPLKEEIITEITVEKLAYLNNGYNLVFTSPLCEIDLGYKVNENIVTENDGYKKGVNCTIAKSSTFSDLSEKIINAQKDGVNSVALLLSNAFQNNTSSVLDEVSDNVITVFTSLLDLCDTIGMDVNIRCACYSKTNAGGENIQPSDLDSWFTNWQARIETFMDIAYPYGVRIVSISNELKYLNALAKAKQYWARTINALKSKYQGLKVVINHNIYDTTINTLDLFDIIGFNCYPCLTRKGLNETDQKLKAALHNDIYTDDNIGYILSLVERYPKKEIWISEIGTQADDLGLFQTWQNTYSNPSYNEEVQAKYYELVMQNIYKIVGTSALYLWSINDGRDGDNNFSFIGKDAEAIVVKYWNGGVRL